MEKRILFIEDSILFQKLLPRYLPEHTITLAISLGVGLTLAMTQTFDLIISDFMFPEGTALDLLCKVRKRYTAQQLPIIVMSSAIDPYLADVFARMQIYSVAKPINQEKLREAIKGAFECRQFELSSLHEVTILSWSTDTESFAYCPNSNSLAQGATEAEASEKLQQLIKTLTAIPTINTIKTTSFRFSMGNT